MFQHDDITNTIQITDQFCTLYFDDTTGNVTIDKTKIYTNNGFTYRNVFIHHMKNDRYIIECIKQLTLNIAQISWRFQLYRKKNKTYEHGNFCSCKDFLKTLGVDQKDFTIKFDNVLSNEKLTQCVNFKKPRILLKKENSLLFNCPNYMLIE